jgi:hypothetical protein
MKSSVALIAIASSLGTAAVAVPATAAFAPPDWRGFCRVLLHTVVKRVPAKPTPPQIVYRDRPPVLIAAKCDPISFVMPPPNTAFTITDADIPELAGVSMRVPRLFPADSLAPPPLRVIQPVAPPPASAVPETATWGMFIVGFGFLGAMMRRRKAVRA